MKNCGLTLLILFVGFAFFGCDVEDANLDDKVPVEEIKANLTASKWELRSVEEEGYGIFAPENDTMYTINFFDDGSLEGKDACNRCEGNYEIDSSGKLIINEMACTEMACHGFQHTISYAYSLHGENSFSFEDEQLYITLNDEENESHTFRFADAESDSPKKVIMAHLDNFIRSNWADGGYHKLEADINKDTLSVELSYSGCGIHDLNIIFYNYFMESFPVQAYAVVAHKNEACRAVFSSKERFDLTPLKKEYQRYYGDSEEDVIDISIWEDGKTLYQIRYAF
ncbi:MAG: META domain-containing protein [Balneolaceae bacterium]